MVVFATRPAFRLLHPGVRHNGRARYGNAATIMESMNINDSDSDTVTVIVVVMMTTMMTMMTMATVMVELKVMVM